MISIRELREHELSLASREMFEEEFRTNRFGTFGYWISYGAKVLGLSNPVCRDEFHNLARGFSPDGNTRLFTNSGETDRIAAWQISLSGSQSLSVLWALAPSKVRSDIESAYLTAATTSLKLFDRGLDGQQCTMIETAKAAPLMLFFSGTTSWDYCPHLHATVFLLNQGIRPDGSVVSLGPMDIQHEQARLKWYYEGGLDYFVEKAIGSFHRCPLSDELRIEGVPQEVVRKFFYCSPEQAHERADRWRGRSLDEEALLDYWKAQAQLWGWGPKQAASLLNELQREQTLAHSR